MPKGGWRLRRHNYHKVLNKTRTAGIITPSARHINAALRLLVNLNAIIMPRTVETTKLKDMTITNNLKAGPLGSCPFLNLAEV